MKSTNHKLRSNVALGLSVSSFSSLMMNTAIFILAILFILISSIISNASPTNNIIKSSLHCVKLGIDSDINTHKGEVLVILYDTTYKAIEHKYNLPKMVEPDSDVPKTSSLSVLGDDQLMNFLPWVSKGYKIPVRVTVGKSGTYTISLLNLYRMSESSYLTLEDLFTGKVIDLNQQSTYEFYMENTITIPRFMLHIGAPKEVQIVDVINLVNTDN
jgi:hypothetical protein